MIAYFRERQRRVDLSRLLREEACLVPERAYKAARNSLFMFAVGSCFYCGLEIGADTLHSLASKHVSRIEAVTTLFHSVPANPIVEKDLGIIVAGYSSASLAMLWGAIRRRAESRLAKNLLVIASDKGELDLLLATMRTRRKLRIRLGAPR